MAYTSTGSSFFLRCGSGSGFSFLMRIRILPPPWRTFRSGSGFHFNADRGPAFHFDAYPDPASCGSPNRELCALTRECDVTLFFAGGVSRSVWLMTDILQSVRRFVKQREGTRDKENRAKKRKVNQIFIQVGQKSS